IAQYHIPKKQLKAEVILEPHEVSVTENYFQTQWLIWSFSASFRGKPNLLDMGSLMIKPIQRVMKYPLLLCELRNSTPPSHPDYRALDDAFAAVKDINVNINELKRRKDLVLKYKKNDEDESLKDKLSKLNIHSISKKSKRVTNHLKILTRGESQVKDNTFNREEKLFRALEKTVRLCVKNISLCLQHIQDAMPLALQGVMDLQEISYNKDDEMGYSETLSNALNSCHDFASHLQRLILTPLSALLSLFPGPHKLIQKRYDKLLDCNSYLQRSAGEESDLARKEYEALNAQLVEELQAFNQAARKILLNCLISEIQNQVLEEIQNLNCVKENSATFIERKLSFEKKKPVQILPEMPHQTDIHRSKLLSTYSAEELYQAKRKCNATQEYDINLLEGELVAVIEQKDPLGSTSRWLVDTGNVKGYVYSSFLKPYNPAKMQKVDAVNRFCDDDFENISLFIFYAVHAFQARSDHELSLQEYQRVHILRFCDLSGNKEWWLAEAQGQKGYVPANYLGKMTYA
uniref:Rho guanine nucleotide exchange factor 38 n=1 Tax=Nomascus leucogenys TaxID=61853 RepID=A0A2I3G9K3_NOMLE